MSRYIPNSFQTPNVLVDQHFKELDPFEITLLMVIIRKTTGWNKDSDTISVNQFEKLTTMGRTTIVGRLKKLEEKKLVTVVRGKIGRSKKTNDYKLGELFYQNNQEVFEGSPPDKLPMPPDDIGGMPRDELPMPPDDIPMSRDDTEPMPPDDIGGMPPDDTTKHKSFKHTVKPTTTKPSGSVGGELSEKTKANFELQREGFNSSEAGKLIAERGADYCLLQIERCDWKCEKEPGSVKNRKAWIRGSINSEEGWDIPPGFVPKAHRAAAAAEREAEARREKERQQQAQAEEAALAVELTLLDKTFDQLSLPDQSEIVVEARQRLANESKDLSSQFESFSKRTIPLEAMPVHVREAFLGCRREVLREKMQNLKATG